jgi:TatD DNase family protein
MIDTHAHVNFNAFKDDAEEVLKRALEHNTRVINVGSQLSSSERSVYMSEKIEGVYAAVGLHPIQLEDFEVEEGGVKFQTRKEDFHYDVYKKLAQSEGCVAIGETGLDYHYIDQDSDVDVKMAKQRTVFMQHIELANEMNLPVIVHTRGEGNDFSKPCEDILDILKKKKPVKGGVMHCYAGPVDLIAKFVELGFYFSFNGILTFDKTGHLAEVLKAVPNNRLLLETDCPYLTPEPFRGKRNEPVYVKHVAEKVAELKNMTFEEVEQLTDENAQSLFSLE